MSKLKTEDCRNWLATDPGIQQLIKDRYGWDPDPVAMFEMCEDDQDEVDYVNSIIKCAAKPGKWKRYSKYNLGSARDKDFRNYAEICKGKGVVREFNLADTEVSVVILEQDGKLSFLDDMSD